MKRYILFTFTIIVFIYLWSTFIKGNPMQKKKLTLKSASFKSGSEIPQQFTCQGKNISPELHWQKGSAEVKSYLLIVDDPDAQRVAGKTFIHWIVIMPPEVTSLAEAASSAHASKLTDFNAIELPNDFHTTYYGGPCPPKGSGIHTYQFTLFSLNQDMQTIKHGILQAPFTAEQAAQELKAYIMEEARITGRYKLK